MFGKRAKGQDLVLLKAKCKELSESGKSANEIGFLLGLHHTTVLWHLGRLEKKKKFLKEKGGEYVYSRRVAIKEGKLIPKKRGKWIQQEKPKKVTVEPVITDGLIFTSATKDRVKGVDGKYYYWCPSCMYKTLWNTFKKDLRCDYCGKSKVEAENSRSEEVFERPKPSTPIVEKPLSKEEQAKIVEYYMPTL